MEWRHTSRGLIICGATILASSHEVIESIGLFNWFLETWARFAFLFLFLAIGMASDTAEYRVTRIARQTHELVATNTRIFSRGRSDRSDSGKATLSPRRARLVGRLSDFFYTALAGLITSVFIDNLEASHGHHSQTVADEITDGAATYFVFLLCRIAILAMVMRRQSAAVLYPQTDLRTNAPSAWTWPCTIMFAEFGIFIFMFMIVPFSTMDLDHPRMMETEAQRTNILEVLPFIPIAAVVTAIPGVFMDALGYIVRRAIGSRHPAFQSTVRIGIPLAFINGLQMLWLFSAWTPRWFQPHAAWLSIVLASLLGPAAFVLVVGLLRRGIRWLDESLSASMRR